MRALLAATALALLGACTGLGGTGMDAASEASAPTAATGHEKIRFDDKRATQAERAKCEAAGGIVGPGGMLGYDQCVQPYADAGKACKGSEDCEGRCLLSADSDDDMGQPTDDGVCQADDSPFGCYTEVNDGVAQYAICVD
tara:strand:- start:1516 stop:1938 length:423 start_codon:yes stop_codon:yes gene_type:complete